MRGPWRSQACQSGLRVVRPSTYNGPGNHARCTAVKASPAKVLQNRACSLDDSTRLLTLSVNDPVMFLEGRKIARKPSKPRWFETYTVPGQRVEVSFNDGTEVSHAVAKSPSSTRRDSVNLDASIIEVVVERDNNSEACHMEYGEMVSVSEVHGTGFVCPINPEVTLTSVLEEQRPLLLAASSAQGIAAVRAAIEWEPLQASATEHPVIIMYFSSSNASASFVNEWETWRRAGATVIPITVSDAHATSAEEAARENGYVDTSSYGGSMDNLNDGTLLPEEDRVIMHVEPLFMPGGQVYELLGDNMCNAAALFAGLPMAESKVLLRCLTAHGMEMDHIMQA